MSLRSEVASLREEARALRSLLVRLEGRIAELEDQVGFELVEHSSPQADSSASAMHPPSTPCRPYGAPQSSGSPAAPRPVASSSCAGSFRDGSSASNPGAPSSEFRVHLAQGIGRFLSGRLSGQATGSSGREQLQLSSKVYIVCRDAQGKDYNPPIVTSAFSRVKQLCFLGQSRSDCGASVFIGLPSQTEVRVALASAGLICPNLSGNGGGSQ